MKPRHVVSVPPRLVELDHVHEDEPRVDAGERLLDQPVGVIVRRRVLARDMPPREQVVHFADAHAGNPRRREPVEQRRARGLDREVTPVGRAGVGPRAPHERPSDHAAHRVLADQQLARRAAGPIQLLQRHRSLVRRHLEDRVGGRVHDPLPRPLVLLPELRDDRRSRGGLVADHPATGAARELADDVLRKALRIGAERLVEQHPADLPVPGRAVLPLRARQRHAVGGGGLDPGRQPGDGAAAPEAEPLQVRKPQPAHRAGHVAERVAASVAVGNSVRGGADAHAVQHDDRRALARVLSGCALQS